MEGRGGEGGACRAIHVGVQHSKHGYLYPAYPRAYQPIRSGRRSKLPNFHGIRIWAIFWANFTSSSPKRAIDIIFGWHCLV